MLNYANIIEQKRAERKKYVEQLNSMRSTHNIDQLQKQYALEIHDCNSFLEKLKLFHELQSPEYPPFASKDEYISTRSRLTEFSSRKAELLNVAATLYTYEENIRRCNAALEKTILDEESYLPGQNNAIHAVTKQFIKNANSFGRYITPEFLFAISLSAINSLSKEDVAALVQDGYITLDDIEKVIDIPELSQKVSELYAPLGIQPPVTETHEMRLKGVSYDNEDGSSRQEYLKELADSPNKDITIDPFTFHNAKENRDEPAAKVMWGEKCIGNLPASFMIELEERMRNVTFSAKVDRVVGGGDFNYGCYIVLEVTGRPVRAQAAKINLADFATRNTPNIESSGPDKSSEEKEEETPFSPQRA